MSEIFTILAALLGLYALVMSVFVIAENRRPQSTLAWMLVLFFAPGIGLLFYLFFGRDNKAFSKRSKLLMQDLQANARPLLSRILFNQESELERLAQQSPARSKLESRDRVYTPRSHGTAELERIREHSLCSAPA